MSALSLKKIKLGTSDTLSKSHTSKPTREPAYYVLDCRILKLETFPAQHFDFSRHFLASGLLFIFWQTEQSLSQIGHTWHLTFNKSTSFFSFQPKFKRTLIKLAQTLHHLPKRKSWINKIFAFFRMFGKYSYEKYFSIYQCKYIGHYK